MTQKLITDDQLDGIAGSKVSGAVALATTVTTNANLSGDVTSVGNTTTLGTVPVAKGGSGQTTANDALNAFLPSQATNNGKVLGTDGTNTSWVTAGGGSGTVTSVSVVTANGVSGSVANATTTPAITLTLGAITPSSVASTGTVTGTNLSGTNTGDQTITLTGDVTGSGTGSFATTLGTVPATKGGTGQTTITTGDVLYGSATNTISKLGIGSAGQVLTVAGGVPTWAAAGGGGATLNSYKEAVLLATTANITLSGNVTVDGVTSAAGNRILVKNQSTASQNGIYVASASAWARAADFNTSGDQVDNGAIIPVKLGTVNGGSTWQLVQNGGTIGNSFKFSPIGGVAIAGLSGNPGPTMPTSSYAVAIGRGASSGSAGAAIGGGCTTGAGALAAGSSCSAVGQYSAALGDGASASALGCYAIGYQVTAGFNSSVVIGFVGSNTEMVGEVTFARGRSSATNDRKQSLLMLSTQTTNATTTEMGLASGYNEATPTNRIVLSNDSSYIFDCDIVARNTATDTESAMYNLKFGIRRGAAAANTAIVGTPVLTVIGEDAGASAWDIAVTADTTNGRPNITVTGETAKTIRWVGSVMMTKVSG